MGRQPGEGRPVVEAVDLTKRYGDQAAVRDVSLEVPAGAIYGFIGPSGSGKTTTVRLLLGVEAPTSGTVRVFQRAPAEFTPADRARIGYLPQLTALYPHLSIAENLKFAASLYGVGPLRRRRRLREVLEFVELTEHRKKLVRTSSGGMQRRTGLAAALLHDPELLFLDEPTAGIDPVLRRKFWDHLDALKASGRTLFVTTQYVGEAAYCDRIAVLSDGRLLTVDTPEGLRRKAFGGERVELVAARPLDDEMARELRDLPDVVDLDRAGTEGRRLRVTVAAADVATQQIQQWCARRGVEVRSLSRHVPSFDDVFIKIVERERRSQAVAADG